MEHDFLGEIIENVEVALEINRELRVAAWEDGSPGWDKLVEQAKVLAKILQAAAQAKKVMPQRFITFPLLSEPFTNVAHPC